MVSCPDIHIVWFKRDLRLQDHLPLVRALENGRVLPLYILEPDLWRQPDLSHRHYLFLKDCLKELDHVLKSKGQGLIVKTGEALDVLTTLSVKYKIKGLWSHQETWNDWTFQRDKKVKAWCQNHSIPWRELPHNGVIRGLKDRDGWANRWYETMAREIISEPSFLKPVTETTDPFPAAEDLGLKQDGLRFRQVGGRQQGLKTFTSFLSHRGEGYTKEMSSPVTAAQSCSRLSPYLAFGALSIREVFQKAEQKRKELSHQPASCRGRWPSALRSFSGRLRWHCHFIQKLEDDPRIEFENMHPAYKGLREDSFREDFFQAWQEGKTGYPLVDACMRSLLETGWLTFRMRAMVTSFASYHLWLPWRPTSLHLARLFTDYEPGIHYSQIQMQSGTTGINSIRLYNPIKQGIDQDPQGHFIRRWIPELKEVPDENLHMPWKAPSKIGAYPLPVVEEKESRQAAAKRLYDLRKSPFHKEEAQKIYLKHGSRKRTSSRQRKKEKEIPRQGELPL